MMVLFGKPELPASELLSWPAYRCALNWFPVTLLLPGGAWPPGLSYCCGPALRPWALCISYKQVWCLGPEQAKGKQAGRACSFTAALSVVDETLSRLTDRPFPPVPSPSLLWSQKKVISPPRRFFRSLAYLSHQVASVHFPWSPFTDRVVALDKAGGGGRRRSLKGANGFPISFP